MSLHSIQVMVPPGAPILAAAEQAARENGLSNAVCAAGLGTTSLSGTPLEICGITGRLQEGTAQLSCTVSDGSSVRPHSLQPEDRCLHFCQMLLAERAPETHRLDVPGGEDLLEALLRHCRTNGLERAVVTGGGGHLARTRMHFATMDPKTDVFRQREDRTALTLISGFVDGGRIHLHALVEGDVSWAGHVEPGCISAGDVWLLIAAPDAPVPDR